MSEWLAVLGSALASAVTQHGRAMVVVSFGLPEQAKADDNDPTSGVCFEVTASGVHVGEAMIGSATEPEALLKDFWVAPVNWLAPGTKLDGRYAVREETAPVLDESGEYSAQDTKGWALMYGTKSWANTTMMLRDRWGASREVERTRDELRAWAAAMAVDPAPLPAVSRVVVKSYATDDKEYEHAVDELVILNT